MNEPIHSNQLIEWLYEPRGGYGYRWWIPGTVVRVGDKRITIKVKLINGDEKLVSVNPKKLRPFSKK